MRERKREREREREREKDRERERERERELCGAEIHIVAEGTVVGRSLHLK